MSAGLATAQRLLAAALATVLLYVVAGELLQAWVNLHTDSWSERGPFGARESDRAEWQRVQNAVAFGQQGWRWKTSLHLDAARVALFGAQAGYLAPDAAGRAVLVATAEARRRSAENGQRLALEARGYLLTANHAGLRGTLEELKRSAPHARIYWRPLVHLLCEFALGDPAMQPLARDAVAWYANWDAAELRRLARAQASVRAFLPAGFAMPPQQVQPARATPAR